MTNLREYRELLAKPASPQNTARMAELRRILVNTTADFPEVHLEINRLKDMDDWKRNNLTPATK